MKEEAVKLGVVVAVVVAEGEREHPFAR